MNYFLLSLIPVVIYLFFKTKKSLHILQQNWYNEGNRYLKWIFKNTDKVFISLDILFIIIVACSLFIKSNVIYMVWALFFFVVTYLYYEEIKKEQVKKPLAFTKRVKRLTITTILVYLLPIIIFSFTYNEANLKIYYLVIGLMIYFNYFIVFIANIINKPIEKYVYHYYKTKAINKLKNSTNMKIVGITGSYGKTSSKNILADILNVKYNAFPTPKNFNTPNGLILTINNYLDKFNDIFIAEMGAFKRGEIKELCDLVHPEYGILTKIGTAHLESFGSRENIQKGKFELIESLPKYGIGVLNGDDPLQLSYKLKNDCTIKWIGIENKDVDVYATDIKMTNKGMTFNCVFKGDKKKYKFETKLLGRNNIYNILAGIMLGKCFGISVEQLQLGVKKVGPIEHRLELKKYGDINIIDDAYNSNPIGSKMALEVLGLMPGKKIIVTPGMIELGSEQYNLNKELGMNIADVCDEVILVGEEQTKPIYDGLIEKKYDKKKIHVINDVKIAFNLMQELKENDTYVLLENDLPDLFNEK